MKAVFRIIGNFWWKLFGGVIYAAIWAFLGIALSVTVIGYPAGLKCFRIAYTVWKPFGVTVTVSPLKQPVFNLLWAMTAGFVLTMLAAGAFLINVLTIAGLALAPQWYKVAKLSLFPFSSVIVK